MKPPFKTEQPNTGAIMDRPTKQPSGIAGRRSINSLGNALLLFMLLVSRLGAQAPLEWHWQNPLPQGNTLFAVRWLEDRFVAVGSSTVVTSPDGLEWTRERIEPPIGGFYDVARGNGLFVAVGPFSVARSSDGEVWSGATITNRLVTVTFAEGYFWAGGAAAFPNANSFAPSIFRSVDGLVWERVHSAPSELRGYINHIIHVDGRFLAAGGAANTGQTILLSSTDGATWSDVTPPSGQVLGILVHLAQGNGNYVVVGGGSQGFLFTGRPNPNSSGGVFVSSDGLDWTVPPNAALDRREIAFGQGQFVSVSGSTPQGWSPVGRSPDGANWSSNFSAFRTGDFALSIGFGAGRFVAVGTDGMIYSSEDGELWTGRRSGPAVGTFGFYGLESFEGRLLAAGYTEGVAESTHGRSWTLLEPPFSIATKALRHQGGQWVMVGGWASGNADIAVSPDGRDWETVLTLEAQGREFYSVTYGGPVEAPLHVVAGFQNSTGTIFTSPDARDWTERALPTDPQPVKPLYAIAWGAGRFVAVGDDGTVITSEDGLVWTSRPPLQISGTLAADLRGIRYLNGRFLALGQRAVFESVDGLAWTERPRPGQGGMLWDVAYADGWYVLVGENGNIVISDDLNTWTPIPPISTALLTKVVAHQGAFYAVGHGSTILSTRPPGGVTAPILSIQRALDGVSVEWNAEGFTLESALGTGGPWMEHVGATSPYSAPTTLPIEIFRLQRVQP